MIKAHTLSRLTCSIARPSAPPGLFPTDKHAVGLRLRILGHPAEPRQLATPLGKGAQPQVDPGADEVDQCQNPLHIAHLDRRLPTALRPASREGAFDPEQPQVLRGQRSAVEWTADTDHPPSATYAKSKPGPRHRLAGVCFLRFCVVSRQGSILGSWLAITQVGFPPGKARDIAEPHFPRFPAMGASAAGPGVGSPVAPEDSGKLPGPGVIPDSAFSRRPHRTAGSLPPNRAQPSSLPGAPPPANPPW